MNQAADQAEAPVVGLTDTFTPERYLPSHTHDKAQLLYTTDGVMLLSTSEGDWVLPPQRALWIPPGIAHSLACNKAMSVYALYVQPGVIRFEQDGCRVLDVTPLLRELIRRAVELPWAYGRDTAAWRLTQVLADELTALDSAPLHLPWPRDPRARAVCERLQQSPGDNQTLAEWSRETGASERTLARLFRSETGMSFGLWRQQLRLNSAVERLAEGESVTAIAMELGYDTTSSFIAAFKRVFGVTPGAYFTDRSDNLRRSMRLGSTVMDSRRDA
ncbi:MAG: helix-turn-helix transcriptional regulator [Ectothiorhodospiraceae bacterium]